MEVNGEVFFFKAGHFSALDFVVGLEVDVVIFRNVEGALKVIHVSLAVDHSGRRSDAGRWRSRSCTSRG